MVRLSNRRLLIDGKPTLILSGEVHYFRLSRGDWADRIKKTKDAGCNALASYIPWIIHEEVEGHIDVSGQRRPEHDIGAFIDMVHDAGLWFIARPGPFVMGEMKNEGIPFWVYEKCPNAIPTTWESKRATSKNLSYLDADFLRYVKRWYDAIMPVLASRMQAMRGPIIAVQLDNEIGMLQCWTGETDLSEALLCDLVAWIQMNYSTDAVRARYPFDLNDPIERTRAMRDPKSAWAAAFRVDYNTFLRINFAKYVAILRGYAEDAGVKNIPFLINIHGSGGGRATTFPIGISQTLQSYTQAEGYWGSSDHYLGELTRQNAGDLYFLNAFMAATNRPEQPLSSVEFEAGSGDYGVNGAIRYSGSATDFKARLSVIQGNRLLNHYLLAGGHNPMLEVPREDGNGRVATTGARHGFAAPIDPEGRLDPTYHSLKVTNQTLSAVADKLADMDEEDDGIALGFIPDYYATDVKRDGVIADIVRKLEEARGPLEGLVRSMLEVGLSFPAVNLQAEIGENVRSVAFACSTCLGIEEQRRLLRFVEKGGRLLLYGRIPTTEWEGKACTVLADGLGIKVRPVVQGSSNYVPTLRGQGWARDEPDQSIWQAQPFDLVRGEVFGSLAGAPGTIAATVPHGSGRAIVVTTEIPLRLDFWRKLLALLDAVPALRHDHPLGGLLLNRVSNVSRERFISLINLDSHDKKVNLTAHDGKRIAESVSVPGRTAKLLPFNVRIGDVVIRSATTEILHVRRSEIVFRGGSTAESVEIETTRTITASGATTTRDRNLHSIVIPAGQPSATVHVR